MKWKHYPAGKVNGQIVQAPLVGSGPYTISCRTNQFVCSYRPTGEHHAVGTYTTLALAKLAAEKHARGQLKALQIYPFTTE